MSMHSEDNATASTTASSVLSSVTTESMSAAVLGIDPLSHVGDGIFLQTKSAKGIAGICVWVALFITCQQVNDRLSYITKLPFWCLLAIRYAPVVWRNIIEMKSFPANSKAPRWCPSNRFRRHTHSFDAFTDSFGAHRTRSDTIINRLIAQCIPHQSLLSLNRCFAIRATTANTEADTDKIRDIIALSNGEARNFVELMNVKTAGVFFCYFVDSSFSTSEPIRNGPFFRWFFSFAMWQTNHGRFVVQWTLIIIRLFDGEVTQPGNDQIFVRSTNFVAKKIEKKNVSYIIDAIHCERIRCTCLRFEFILTMRFWALSSQSGIETLERQQLSWNQQTSLNSSRIHSLNNCEIPKGFSENNQRRGNISPPILNSLTIIKSSIRRFE